MESFEFLGGRYNRPEQIMSGPVQAFKAQNAANGRTVFIHRVSTTEAPEQQSALLKLLTTALVKSSDAKRLVLDFGEERGYWYVVTESEPQCALLREWLQTEIASALAGSKAMTSEGSPLAAKPSGPMPAPTPPADPGEFTRFLQRPSMSPVTNSRAVEPKPVAPPPSSPPPAPPAVGEFSRFFQNHGANPPTDGFSAPPAPGEFTAFFKTTESEQKTPPAQPPAQFTPPQPVGPAQNPEQKKEPGEFTRFFTPGLPAAPPKPPAAPSVLNFERPQNNPQNNPYVQRPNSPVPPAPPPKAPLPKPTEPGEFTRMFSSKPSAGSPPAQQPYQPVPAFSSDQGFSKPPSNQLNDLSDNLFNSKIDVGAPLPSSQPQQSEFTKVFGPVGTEAPPIAPHAVVSPRVEKSMLDDAQATQQFSPPPQQSPFGPPSPNNAGAQEPSEFTRIMRGGYGQSKPSPAGVPPPAGPPPPVGGAPSPLNVKISPIAGAPLPFSPSASGSVAGMHGNVSQHGASAGSALGSANVGPPKLSAGNLQVPDPAKAAANKKLLVFFALLGILTIVLIAVILILMKSK